MAVLVRVEKGRNGFVTLGSVTVAVRVYYNKDESYKAINQEISSNESLSKSAEKILLKTVRTGYNGIRKQLEKDNQTNLEPERLLIYYNAEDDFFSCVYCLRYLIKKTKIGELRASIARACAKGKVYLMYVNNYDSHLPVSEWDTEHCQDEPLYDFLKENAINVCCPDLKQADDKIVKKKRVTREKFSLDDNDLISESENVDLNTVQEEKYIGGNDG